MTAPPDVDDLLAEAVPLERLDVALAAYHDARLAGLCHDGAWEVALGALPPDRSASESSETPT